MKKIISILLLAAMLVGCLSSAVIVSAADATLAVESVEKMQGTSTEMALALSIENNPGLSAISFVVYYDKAQLAQGSSDAFDGALASAADSVVNAEVVGTNNKVKNFIPSDVRSASKAFTVDLVGAYNEGTEETDPIVGDGVLCYIPLNIIAEDLGDYNYNVVVTEAYDVNGEELALNNATGTVSYVADPYIGIYDEFTVFMKPDAADVTVGTTEISVDIRFDNNPGLWATRLYVVYPEALSLSNGGNANVTNNTGIFLKEADMLAGVPDLEFGDDRLVQGFKDVIAADPSIVREGYRSTTLYFERTDAFDEVYYGNGVLCTLNFNVVGDVEAGDVLDIVMYYGEMDFLFADTDESGEPVFIDYYPPVYGADFTIVDKVCEHTNTTADHKDATCGEAGYDKVVCDDCGATVSETEIPATGEHTEGAPEVTESTCNVAGKEVYNCSVCGAFIREVALELAGHTAGAEATCQAAQTCTVCGVELAAKLDHIEGEAVRTNPKCEEDGKEVYNCSMCGEFMREEIIPATGHSYLQMQGAVIVPPTCTEDGYTTRFCDYCGEPKVTDPVPAWGHDLEGVEGVVTKPATCCEEGELTFYCSYCDEVAKVEAIPVTATHNLEYVAAVEPNCHQTGNTEYWYCVDCDAVYTDAEGIHLSNRKNVTIAALNELAYVPAAEACHVAGTQEYWFCPECDAVFADAAGTQITNRKNLEIAPDCELAYVPAAEACHVAGSAEYWYCPECDAVYADAEGTIRTNRKNLEIAPDCELVHMDAVVGCHTPGISEYWYCPECDAVYADAEGTVLTNRKNLETAPTNELVYVPAAEACHVAGIAEYWYCPECDAVYADEAATILTNRKNLEIAPDCELVHMDKVEACHANGTEEYWFCPECEAVYADAAGTVLTNRMNLTIPADAEAKHVEAVKATCTENGMAEYWYCEECDTFFADAECKYNVAYLSLTIPATGHDYKDGVCSVCGDKDEEKKPSAPVTGDNMIFIVIALAVVLLAGAAIVLFRRKRAN